MENIISAYFAEGKRKVSIRKIQTDEEAKPGMVAISDIYCSGALCFLLKRHVFYPA